MKATHNVPHLSRSFKQSDNSIALTTSYATSLCVFPALICAAGLISIFIFMIFWIFRCIFTYYGCCNCLRCIPDDVNARALQGEQLTNWRENVSRNKKKVMWLYLTVIILAFLAIHTTFIGNMYVSKGVDKGSNAVDGVNEVFITMADLSQNISSNALIINSTIRGDSCVSTYSEESDVYSVIDQITSITDSIYDILHPLTSDMSDIHDLLTYYGVYVKTLVLFNIYAAIALLLVLYAIGLYFRSMKLTRVLIFLSIFILSVLIVLSMVYTIVLVCYKCSLISMNNSNIYTS